MIVQMHRLEAPLKTVHKEGPPALEHELNRFLLAVGVLPAGRAGAPDPQGKGRDRALPGLLRRPRGRWSPRWRPDSAAPPCKPGFELAVDEQPVQRAPAAPRSGGRRAVAASASRRPSRRACAARAAPRRAASTARRTRAQGRRRSRRAAARGAPPTASAATSRASAGSRTTTFASVSLKSECSLRFAEPTVSQRVVDDRRPSSGRRPGCRRARAGRACRRGSASCRHRTPCRRRSSTPTWPRLSSAPLFGCDGRTAITRKSSHGGQRSFSASTKATSGDQRNWLSR